MIINRKWEMPNSKTFKIIAFRELIQKYSKPEYIVLDPFANECSIKEHLSSKVISNDLDPSYKTDYNLEANDFLKLFDDCSVDMVLFDPPYTPRQVAEVYTKLEKTVTISDTQSSYWGNFKREISRVLKVGGICISFGWNSNGIGMTNSMKIIEILLVAHGGIKNDTLATVEMKTHHQDKLL